LWQRAAQLHATAISSFCIGLDRAGQVKRYPLQPRVIT